MKKGELEILGRISRYPVVRNFADVYTYRKGYVLEPKNGTTIAINRYYRHRGKVLDENILNLNIIKFWEDVRTLPPKQVLKDIRDQLDDTFAIREVIANKYFDRYFD